MTHQAQRHSQVISLFCTQYALALVRMDVRSDGRTYGRMDTTIKTNGHYDRWA